MFNELQSEETTYSLLIACSNQDLLMFRYLWETYAPLFWDLSNFKVVMKQLIHQRWKAAIEYLFESEVTQ